MYVVLLTEITSLTSKRSCFDRKFAPLFSVLLLSYAIALPESY